MAVNLFTRRQHGRLRFVQVTNTLLILLWFTTLLVWLIPTQPDALWSTS